MYSNYYIRDASGNVMATYKSNIDTVAGSIVYTVGERHIYGSDRVGMYTYADTVYPVPPASIAPFKPVWRGHRKYELKNHLGNVTTVINGNKLPVKAETGNLIVGFDAIIESAYDYSPFGVTRKSFEPNYTAGTSGEVNPLAPDFRWCLDGDGVEANGSGHDAILYHTTTTVDRNNETGHALESHGNADSYIEIQHHPDLVFGTNDFTVGIWVKRLALNNEWNHTIAAGKWHSGQEPSQNEWYLAISNGGSGNNPPQFAIQAGGTKYTAAGTALPVGSWYHLVGVREGDYIKLYVDGTLVDTKYVGAAVVNTVPSRNIYLGLMGNGKFLKAGFDEFVVYHRALDANEVNELYGLGCGDFEGEEGVLASGGYRYGFGSHERMDEVMGSGNWYAFGDYGYNPRIVQRPSVDPMAAKFPQWSPYSAFANNPIRYNDPDGQELIDPRTGKPISLNLYRAAVYESNYIDHTKLKVVRDDDLYAHASPWIKRERSKPDGMYDGAVYNIHESNFQHTTSGAIAALGNLFPNVTHPGADWGSPNDGMWRNVAEKGSYLFLDDRYSESEWLHINQTEFNVMKVEENYITQIVNLTRPDGDGKFNINTVTNFDIQKGDIQSRQVGTWWGGTKTEKFRNLTVTETAQRYKNNKASGAVTTKTYSKEEIMK